MSFKEIKVKIDAIREEYGSNGDIIFRTAISTLMDCGQQSFQNDEWFEGTMAEIDERHARVEKEGKILIMTAPFEKGILNCARELAKFNTVDLFMYIQRCLWMSDGYGEISYGRAVDLLANVVDHCLWNDRETDAAYEELCEIGFDEDELIALGFEEVFFNEEDDE